MADKKATRESYGAALAELGEKYDFVVLDADLAAATKTGVFKKKFPERFFDCGIAEGNMVSVAAGIATTGKKVFATSFAMFAAGRAYEQIRNSIGYPHLNVNIVGTHASITVGEDGATHQCSEDLALMRTIPGMTVICPADATEAYAAVEATLNFDGPCYLRFGRFAVPDLTPELVPNYKFELGKGVTYREGKDVTIVANGFMVHLAVEAAELLKAEGIDAGVINIHTIKPLDTDLLVKAAKNSGAIVTQRSTLSLAVSVRQYARHSLRPVPFPFSALELRISSVSPVRFPSFLSFTVSPQRTSLQRQSAQSSLKNNIFAREAS